MMIETKSVQKVINYEKGDICSILEDILYNDECTRYLRETNTLIRDTVVNVRGEKYNLEELANFVETKFVIKRK